VNRKHLARPFELKTVDEKTGEFAGYGSVFDVVDWYRDVVIKGAFANSLAAKKDTANWPKMLWQHRAAEPIGVWTVLREDEKGLWCEGRLLLEVERAREAHALLKGGALSGLSIGFDYVPGGYEYDQKRDAYILKQVDLWEVSPVTFPANEAAQIEQVKAALDGGPKDFERFLREAGLSRSQAKGLMARGFEGLTAPREADVEVPEAVRALHRDLIAAIRGEK
jgi:HK97 family phage prohead protease